MTKPIDNPLDSSNASSVDSPVESSTPEEDEAWKELEHRILINRQYKKEHCKQENINSEPREQ